MFLGSLSLNSFFLSCNAAQLLTLLFQVQNVLGFVDIVLGIHLFSSDLKKYLLLFVYFLYSRQNHCKLNVILQKSRLLQ